MPQASATWAPSHNVRRGGADERVVDHRRLLSSTAAYSMAIRNSGAAIHAPVRRHNYPTQERRSAAELSAEGTGPANFHWPLF
jgi:hypothetical protein